MRLGQNTTVLVTDTPFTDELRTDPVGGGGALDTPPQVAAPSREAASAPPLGELSAQQTEGVPSPKTTPTETPAAPKAEMTPAEQAALKLADLLEIKNYPRPETAATETPTTEQPTQQPAELSPADKAALEMAKLFGVKDYPGVESAVDTQKNAVPEETTVTVRSGPSAITEKTRNDNTLAYILASNLETVKDMAPVKALTGHELNTRGMKVSDQIANFFKSIGNKIFRKNFGDVNLGEYGVGGMLNHRPLNRAKMVSLAAVPEVITNGKQISYDPNWKGRGYESYVFAAPVTVSGTEVYVAAVVDKRPDNKFYLSEMVDSEGNYVRIEESPSGNSKNGVTDGARDSGKAGITARPEGLSEGGNPSAQSAEPTPLFNDSIRRPEQNVNPIAPKSELTPAEQAALELARLLEVPNYPGLEPTVDTVAQTDYDIKNEQGGAIYGTEQTAETYDDGRTKRDTSANQRTPRGAVTDRSGIPGNVGKEASGSSAVYLPGRQRGGLTSTNKDFGNADYLTPEEGTPLHELQRTFQKSGINCHIIKSVSWKANSPAYAKSGEVFISEKIDPLTLSTAFPHETTHVMKQQGFQPYLDFAHKTPDLMPLHDRNSLELLNIAAEHRGVDIFEMSDKALTDLYDELNAIVYGLYKSGILEDSQYGFEWIPDAFSDFGAYIAELDGIHKQFVNERKTDVTPHPSVGAADQGFDHYSTLQYTHGNKPDRSSSLRDINVPNKDAQGRRVSDHAANLYGSSITANDTIPHLERLIEEGHFGADIKHNRDILQNAQNSIAEQGADAVRDEVVGAVRDEVVGAVSSGTASEDLLAKALVLYAGYQASGDIPSACDMAVYASDLARTAARTLNVAKLTAFRNSANATEAVITDVADSIRSGLPSDGRAAAKAAQKAATAALLQRKDCPGSHLPIPSGSTEHLPPHPCQHLF